MGVQAIIDNAILTAQNKANLADAQTGVAINMASSPVLVTAGTVTANAIREPNVVLPTRADGLDMAVFDTVATQVMQDLSDRFYAFLQEFFPPNLALMQAVESWLQSAIAGGTGINTSVEAKIWQRDRDRITREASSAAAQAGAQWAARGFPMPPGALVSVTQAIEAKRQEDVAAVSRAAAIKAFETEVENVRFAIGQAVDYRTRAIGAAGDYIRALAVGPNLAANLATQSSDAQARLISAVSGFYNARTNAHEAVNRVATFSTEQGLRAALANQETATKMVGLRVDATMAAAQSLGQQAAAALNAVNATSQLIESVG